MNRKITYLLPMLALVFAACIRTLDDEGICQQSRIYGHVIEQASQQPVSGLHVSLLVDTESVATTRTDTEGYFSVVATAQQLSHSIDILVVADSLYESTQRSFAPQGYGRPAYDVGVLYVAGPLLPSVSTVEVGQVSATDVHCSGAVDSDGRSAVTCRGFVFSTMQYPTLADGRIDAGSGLGQFQAVASNLQPGTQYYLRAFATNGVGTAYGQQVQFSTLGGMPTVSTADVVGITATTANCGGVALADAGFGITARGVCWSTSPEPTVTHAHTTDGTGLGQYVSTLVGLQPATTYYVRAYAVNSVGTAYGTQHTFTTHTGLPEVSTGAVSAITATSAQCGGTVSTDGDFGVTARGICYSTTPQPTTAGPHTTDGSGMGQFISHLLGLTPTTQYYVRAYATNATGTVYGEEKKFTTAE